MTTFSRRNGYNIKNTKLECADDALKRRIMGTFCKQELKPPEIIDWAYDITGIEDMMIKMGVPHKFPKNDDIRQENADTLRKFVVDSEEWYTIFDFIERYLAMSDKETSKKMAKEFNLILEDEASAYRIIENLVVPVTNESEFATIGEAMNLPYNSVQTHISKALSLYADRKNPDYENSIKKSISAVESMCCIITGLTGTKATLGAAIKKLKDNGVHIHGAMVDAFSSLYGYTSDESGIRHGGIDFKNAPAEDAKYMLISCSAFVNYLIEKWRKVNS